MADIGDIMIGGMSEDRPEEPVRETRLPEGWRVIKGGEGPESPIKEVPSSRKRLLEKVNEINSREETILTISQLINLERTYVSARVEAGDSGFHYVPTLPDEPLWNETSNILYTRQRLFQKEGDELLPTGKSYDLHHHSARETQFLREKGKLYFSRTEEGITVEEKIISELLKELGLSPEKEYVVVIPGNPKWSGARKP